MGGAPHPATLRTADEQLDIPYAAAGVHRAPALSRMIMLHLSHPVGYMVTSLWATIITIPVWARSYRCSTTCRTVAPAARCRVPV